LRRSIRSLICLSLLSAGVARSEIQTQHAFDSSLKTGRFQALWHLRARTKPEGGGLFQVRTGPILEFDLNKRVTLIGGHYFTREQGERGWTTINRTFGGGELTAYDRAVEIDWRSLLERFVIPGERDYFRFRNRLRLSPPGVTAPYVAIELFLDARGVRSTRYSAGVRRTIDREFIVDIGYFFEDRRPMPGGERHMFSTSFHWRNKTRHIDPDF
jgi:hypothetical protein